MRVGLMVWLLLRHRRTAHAGLRAVTRVCPVCPAILPLLPSFWENGGVEWVVVGWGLGVGQELVLPVGMAGKVVLWLFCPQRTPGSQKPGIEAGRVERRQGRLLSMRLRLRPAQGTSGQEGHVQWSDAKVTDNLPCPRSPRFLEQLLCAQPSAS